MTILTREVATGLAVRDDGDGRILFGPLLPWNVEARVWDRGRLVVETFTRGALAGADPGRVVLTARPTPATPPSSLSAAWSSWKSATTPHGWPPGSPGPPPATRSWSWPAMAFRWGCRLASAKSWAVAAGRPTAAASPEPGPSSTTWPSCGRRPMWGPGWWGCASRGHGRPRRTRCCPWPGCAMGKARWIYSPKPGRQICIGCRTPLKGPGDRCPSCAREIRQRHKRKPR